LTASVTLGSASTWHQHPHAQSNWPGLAFHLSSTAAATTPAEAQAFSRTAATFKPYRHQRHPQKQGSRLRRQKIEAGSLGISATASTHFQELPEQRETNTGSLKQYSLLLSGSATDKRLSERLAQESLRLKS